MPDATRRLIAALRSRRIHKRAVEVSARAGDLFQRLGALYYRPRDRRAAEITLAEMAAHISGLEVHDSDVLIDIPKPEKWSADVWVEFDRPPIGFSPLMPWHEAVGAQSDDFRRYEEHRRLIRIVATEPLRDCCAASGRTSSCPSSAASYSPRLGINRQDAKDAKKYEGRMNILLFSPLGVLGVLGGCMIHLEAR